MNAYSVSSPCWTFLFFYKQSLVPLQPMALYFQKFVGVDLADVIAKACHVTWITRTMRVALIVGTWNMVLEL